MIDHSVVYGYTENSDETSDQDLLPTTRQRVVVYVSGSAKSRAAGKLPCTAT